MERTSAARDRQLDAAEKHYAESMAALAEDRRAGAARHEEAMKAGAERHAETMATLEGQRRATEAQARALDARTRSLDAQTRSLETLLERTAPKREGDS